jgi:hypothetical protein
MKFTKKRKYSIGMYLKDSNNLFFFTSRGEIYLNKNYQDN